MPLDIRIDYNKREPVYRQIVDAVAAAIASKRLQKDERLPTIHELACKLDINPNTVARAYRDLVATGHVVGLRGQGTFPAEKRPPSEDEKEALLKEICHRALADGARHSLTAKEIGNFLRRLRA